MQCTIIIIYAGNEVCYMSKMLRCCGVRNSIQIANTSLMVGIKTVLIRYFMTGEFDPEEPLGMIGDKTSEMI